MTKQPTFRMAAFCAALLASPLSAQDMPADNVVATVNGTDITLGQMAMTKRQLPPQYQDIPAKVLYDGILEQLIQQTVLGQSLKDTPKEVQVEIENATRTTLAGAAISDIMQQPISDEALKAAYATKYEGADPQLEFNASHILVATKAEAEAVKNLLDAGADFAATAREKSTGPSGPNGGELGWFGAGRMVKPFEDAVSEMKAGDISAPVETQFGWHIIKLNDKRQLDAPAFDTVKDELKSDIQKEALDAKIASLVSGATVTRAEDGAIDPEMLNSPTLFGK